MTATSTTATSLDEVAVAWWVDPHGDDTKVGMFAWRGNDGAAHLVTASRTRMGLELAGAPHQLRSEVTDQFVAAAPESAKIGLEYLPCGPNGPTFEELHTLSEGDGTQLVSSNAADVVDRAMQRPHQPAAADAPIGLSEVITLPDGRLYRSRSVADITDVELLRRTRGHLFTRIKGPSGTGKTTLAEAAFGEDLIVVEGHGQLQVDDLVGKWVPREDGPGYRFAHGPLSIAMRQGKVLLIDELTRIPSDTVNVLMGPADDRRILVIDALPDEPVLHAAEGFHIVATYNDTGVGVRPLDAAVLRRLPLELEATTDFTVVAQLGIDPRLVRAGRQLAARNAARLEAGQYAQWVPETGHLVSAQRALDAGLGEAVAAATLIAACPDGHDRPEIVAAMSDAFGIEAGALQQQVTS